jgi:rubredoxin
MKRYECLVCGEVYDPKMGDYEGAIEPGVPFDALPDAWVCPECGAPREDFIEIEHLDKAMACEDGSPATPAVATKFVHLLAGSASRH